MLLNSKSYKGVHCDFLHTFVTSPLDPRIIRSMLFLNALNLVFFRQSDRSSLTSISAAGGVVVVYVVNL
jgi:hypothetical protein